MIFPNYLDPPIACFIFYPYGLFITYIFTDVKSVTTQAIYVIFSVYLTKTLIVLLLTPLWAFAQM